MDEEADYYDEFGNYIGPTEGHGAEIEDYSGDYDELLRDDREQTDMNDYTQYSLINSTHTSVVLQEDKKYFPSASEVYGESVQVLVEEEDAQPLTEPIIAPIKEILVDTQEENVPAMNYSIE